MGERSRCEIALPVFAAQLQQRSVKLEWKRRGLYAVHELFSGTAKSDHTFSRVPATTVVTFPAYHPFVLRSKQELNIVMFIANEQCTLMILIIPRSRAGGKGLRVLGYDVP